MTSFFSLRKAAPPSKPGRSKLSFVTNPGRLKSHWEYWSSQHGPSQISKPPLAASREGILGVTQSRCGSNNARQGKERGATHLEEAVVMDHPVLSVQQGQQRVLGVQQHLALPFLLALYSLLSSLLQGEDLSGSTKRKRANAFLPQNGWTGEAGSRLPCDACA